MTKKKKEELTIEEKLEQALVPESEWPYQIPENWVWTYLQSIADWGSGGTPYRKNKDYYGDDIPWLKTGELNNGYIYDTEERISELGLKESSAKLFPINTVVIAMYGATIGKVGILGVPATTNQACAAAIAKNGIEYKYIFYYLISQKDTFIKLGKGGAQPNISQEIIKKNKVPLPPAPEQLRIVDRIESLFEKLDRAKDLIKEVIDSYENRKAAILHQAFSGELTKRWRKENGIGMDSWESYTLKDVCSIPITDGTHQTPTYCQKENGVPFISAKDVKSGEINWENIKYITEDLHIKLHGRIAPQKNDILLAKNGTTGVAALVETDKIFDIYVTLALLRPRKDTISPKYLLNIINSPNTKLQFNEKLTGIGVPNLHLRDIRNVEIKVPKLSEQNEIICVLEKVFRNEQIVQEEMIKKCQKIDVIKKSILSRAFRSELGTNNPKDESAMELLKRVL